MIEQEIEDEWITVSGKDAVVWQGSLWLKVSNSMYTALEDELHNVDYEEACTSTHMH